MTMQLINGTVKGTMTPGDGIEKIESEMKFRTIMLTPALASRLLNHNHPNNRRIKKNKIDQYVMDINEGRWRLTHQPIASDEDGLLVDGQNRCHACIVANKPIPVSYCTGVPRKSMVSVDCGSNRNVADAAKISGMELKQASNVAGVARIMFAGMTRERIGIEGTLQFIKSHREALDFCFEFLKKNVRYLTQSPIRAVIARAWYSKNERERIEKFCKVYMDGLPEHPQQDSGAIRLRNWLLQSLAPGKSNIRGTISRVVVYAKTERALKAFIDKEPVTKLIETSEELFPIPGE